MKKPKLNIGYGSDGNAGQNDGGQFVQMGDLRQLFGITRPTAYLLANQGKIRTVSLRQAGRVHGRRLVNVLSVRAYLQELQGEQGAKRKQNQQPCNTK
jgi:hypothetical protein